MQQTDGQTELVIALQDNGPGIPEELLPKLFEPYITSKRKGTGLGLAIVKKIVEEHNGQLSARNANPKGAIITITLPLNMSTNLVQDGRDTHDAGSRVETVKENG